LIGQRGRRPDQADRRSAEARAEASRPVEDRVWRGDLYGALILLMLTGIVALDDLRQDCLVFHADILTQFPPGTPTSASASVTSISLVSCGNHFT